MGEPYWVESRKRWVGAIEGGWTTRGTRKRLTVSAPTKRECLQKMRAKERELLISGAPDESTRAGITVKAWADTWLALQERTLRPSAYTATRSQLARWIIPTIGHKRLDRLSPADVRSVTAAIETAGLATSSARRAHAELVRMLNAAHQEGHAVPDRARQVKYGTGGKRSTFKHREAMNGADKAALLNTIEKRADRARWLLALRPGVRPAEARGIRWSSVDLDVQGVIVLDWQLKQLPYKVRGDRSSGFRVPRDYEVIHLHDAFHLVRPKTKSGWRVVPLDDELLSAMRDWRDVAPHSTYDLVFPRADGKALDDKMDREAWWAMLDLAGLPRRPLYEARHTAATALMAAGIADADAAAIMGHSSITSTRPYQHADVERGRAALERARRSAPEATG